MTLGDSDSTIERWRLAAGRTGFVVAVIGLAVGSVLFLAGQPVPSTFVVSATVAVLAALPVINVLAVFAKELLRRDWAFVALSLGVLATLAYAILDRMRSIG